jgi:hypothetical protein
LGKLLGLLLAEPLQLMYLLLVAVLEVGLMAAEAAEVEAVSL